MGLKTEGFYEILFGLNWAIPLAQARTFLLIPRRRFEPMIKRIIEYSAHNRVLILIVTSIFIFFGAYSFKQIPVDAIPDLSDTKLLYIPDGIARPTL